MDLPQTPELSTDDKALAAFDALLEPTVSTEPGTPEAPPEPTPEPEPPPVAADAERNPDGTFKGKEKKPRHDPQARIDEVTAKYREEERKRVALEAEIQALKAPKPAEPAKPVVVDDPEPDPTDLTKYPAGEYDPKYLREAGRWDARQEFKKQAAEQAKTQARERQLSAVEGRMAAYGKRVSSEFKDPTELDAYLTALPPDLQNLRPSDVQAILEPNAPVTARTAIADCISDAAHPKRLLDHFTAHPDDFQRLSTLHPIQVIREMGRLEATLDAATTTRTAPAPPQSKARPPVPRVESAPLVEDTAPGDDADLDAHVAHYNRLDRHAARS